MTTLSAGAVRRRAARLPRGALVGAVVAVWVLLWIPLRGRDTLELSTSELTPLHERVNDLRDAINSSRGSSPVFTAFFDVIRQAVDALTVFLQSLISQPAYGRPVPLIGWLGVVAVATLCAYAVGNLRVAVLTAAGFTSFGLLGYWQQSMDTLALTLAAVLICLLIGIPLGIWAGLSDRLHRVLTPVLDFMQTMPTFVYLAPLTLFFLIGPASGVIATLIYAMPPVIRITAHGIRTVALSSVEAGTSLGATKWQLLRTVRVPLAKRTIVLGVNQTVMCALSMVTIAALIDAPGLGQVVLRALQTLDVGTAFSAGLAIVIMAIVLDRVTTAARDRVETQYRLGPKARGRRRVTLAGLGVGAAVSLYLSYTYVWAAFFPGPDSGGVVGGQVASGVTQASDWVQVHLGAVTDAIRNAISYGLLNPLQSLIAESPWYLVSTVVLALAWIVAGARIVPTVAVCLGLLVATGLWQEAMVTLAATLVATVIVMALGVVVGVWMGRSDRADGLIRPTLDAAQVMPAFVYLVPFLGLFGASRFTAIVAAVVFAAPVAIKLVADGVRGVPATVVEAATASGSSSWQVITKVQLPLARQSLTLAANQGLIYVLSMVVVGGLVGAGALGYLVVAGFSQSDLYGKGLAAGVAVVLLGVLLDRTTQAAARRFGADVGNRG
ncbi:glycine/betaine ABC transporter permease [Asanoa ishikariensis]|uniref:Glycine betaine/proline transport system permease protein n=1 Tax=Asanoa ishikariensis TaxID=137265 RepID=A0A1H3TGL5_9ACTN|nr:ABC transporter permease subunit [Asanoa ishikariensis]GIF62554.1 glycine/betaine ABC transporter permease [Asanoa ishikariensis]SDZ48805.1 glycine betaine/proline transport system permease protein [Asanoa ishikariensis]